MSATLLQEVGYFLVALAILITVHELGHFAVARLLGVGVIRFSVGFGRPLLRWQRCADTTEYVLAAIPLGGYVKMVDEREDEVPPARLHLAFNRQPLWRRVAIVAAGPAANLLFAVLAYWVIFMAGESGVRAVVASVEPDSIAAQGGFQAGDRLLRVGNREATIWDHAVFAFMAEAGSGDDLRVTVRDAEGREQDRLVDGQRMAALPEDASLIAGLGLNPRPPRLPAVVGDLVPGEPAQRAGLQPGDRILVADGEPVRDWAHWVEMVQARPGKEIVVAIERAGAPVTLRLTPRAVEKDGKSVGRIGAGVLLDRVEIRYGPLAALAAASHKTLDMSLLTVRVIARMLVGRASVENLSGPITMAKVAGQTANAGWDAFVKFLAVVSISLGVLNLLPIPVLDGGHLLFFFIEWVKGSPLSEYAQLQGQKVGIVLIAALMGLAFFVDLSRLFG
ncbi:RIP metalloprotease RseP [Candidatus Thiodictyon syntrophicum]|jgi:regulator of sigma E protease|uniref:Zinc metalloprotease n=1 Tax=Candidatus Thiodictyon syntrophicum TaxID=1166950 RepID=A0A2K8UCJ8_9GAMM|nr:RIP metalloprotease RseP [Candidatus Thiodictyon syntrophicum]AUB83322.1 RIP metalloprotease RseP [Candidatus Thiodictyon syntrophicum]